MKTRKAFTPLETIVQPEGKKVSLTGFTLVELLIASSISAVIMLTVYSAFHSGIFGYRNIENTLDTYQTSRIILERINLDLRNSFAYSADEARFAGSKNKIAFLTLVDSYSEDKVIQEMALVSYELDGNKLMRLCKENQEALKENSEVQPEELADNVEIEFEYGYIPAGDNEIKFKDLWDDKTKLPLAVRVNLIVEGKAEQEFERTVYLPLAE